jgi:hypothetical protein
MMNDHLISRSRFLDALVLDADNKTDLIQVHHALEKAVISPDEVRGVGEWIRLDVHKGMEQYKCSVCLTPVYVPECMGEPLYGFCPVCGARMKGVSEDA